MWALSVLCILNMYDGVTEDGGIVFILRNEVEVPIALLRVGVNHDAAWKAVTTLAVGEDGDGHGWCLSVVGEMSIADQNDKRKIGCRRQTT